MSLLSLSHWALSHSDAVCCYSYAQNSAQLQRRAFANLLALFLWITTQNSWDLVLIPYTEILQRWIKGWISNFLFWRLCSVLNQLSFITSVLTAAICSSFLYSLRKFRIRRYDGDQNWDRTKEEFWQFASPHISSDDKTRPIKLTK